MSLLLSIDGNSLLHRAYWALPEMHDSQKRPTNAVYGFFAMLFKIIEEYNPNYVAVAFDLKEKTFRHNMFKEYKAGRRKTPEDLIVQFDYLKDALTTIGIGIIGAEGFEADDIIGALSIKATQNNVQNIIFTGDKDELQLISENVNVALTKKGVSEIKLMTTQALKEEMGITPLQIIELKALMGDTSDNISGVAGVGEKTALKLISEYGNIENLYKNIENLPKNKLYEKLKNGEKDAFLSKELATIAVDMPLKTTLEELKFNGFAPKAMEEMCLKYSFNNFLKRFTEHTATPPKREIETITLSIDSLQVLDDAQEIALMFRDNIFLATDSNREYEIKLKQTLIDDGYDLLQVLEALKPYLNTKKIIAHDIKAINHKYFSYGIHIKAFFDIMLADWVLNPSHSKYDIQSIFSRENKQVNCCEMLLIYSEQKENAEKNNLNKVLYEIEFPLLEVLFNMEEEGFFVCENTLKELGEKYSKKIDELTVKIYNCADCTFNINSTKQLAEVLFEKLMLPSAKKTKTGYSTNIEVLEQLEDKHEIIPYIMEYRTLTKLKSTYIDGLLALSKEGIIHTTFLQSATATGRLSSVEPNLQNIPIKTALATDIRSAFIAPEGYTIISADYSQIELRILAHIAKDKHLTDAFCNNEDIHARTAAEIIGIPISEVTKKQRDEAKGVNFGIVYGISDFGLAKNINITRKQAKQYIDKYFEEFTGVQKYMKDIVQKAQKDGFVRTMFDRIRYIPELSSKNFNIRSFGQRAALNTPIQGSAADIIKIAMIHTANRLNGLKSKLVLQVHDELIIYAQEREVEEVKQLLKDCMQNAVSITVPLTVNVAQGKNWAEAK